MSRLDKIKKIINLDDTMYFVERAEASSARIKQIYLSSIPEDEKYEKIFSVCVQYGLCDNVSA